ncbi:MAG TPA: hypothetical protein VNT26_01270 [Candidatus Sulfotelmatobacter sp.]|nr:hypothetical protein [Candidatus Sulfotelmatobacter sp.]
MDTLAKWLFPSNPRMVRHRKLQMLFCTLFMSVLACAVVGGVVFLLYMTGQR